jgi:hypothetical protein
MPEPPPWEQLQRARVLEKVLAEVRARTMWGESPESLRLWLLGHEAEIPESLADEMIRMCRRERSLTLRRSGTRDLILGGVLLVGGGAALVVCVLRIDAGAGTPEFAGAVASAAPAAIGLLLVLRGLERVVFGARVEGEANDTVFWD